MKAAFGQSGVGTREKAVQSGQAAREAFDCETKRRSTSRKGR